MSEVGRKREREKSQSLPERICRALDIEPDILPGASLVEIRGRSEISINGGGRIIDYTVTEIRIALKRGAVAVRGKELTCASFCAGKVRIEGRIDSVSFEKYDESLKGGKGGKLIC